LFSETITGKLDFACTSDFNVAVRRWLFIVLAVVALTAILYVTISPDVDLDPTVNRAWQRALLLLCLFAWLAKLSIRFSTITCLWRFPHSPALNPPVAGRSGRSSDCSLLC